MYKVNPSDSRTDLYGLGKGAAQVIDLSPLREQAAAEQEMNFKKQAQKQKTEADRQADIDAKIEALNDGKIFARDQELFGKRRNELIEYTRKNISKLRESDADAWTGFHQLYGDISTEMKLSEQAKVHAAKLFSKPLDNMDEEDVKNAKVWANTPGNYNWMDINISPRVNVYEEIGKMSKTAEVMADDYTGQGKKFGKAEADQLIDERLTDELFARQSLREFNEASDETLRNLGLDRQKNTAADYIKAQYADNLYVADKARPRASGSGAGDKNKIKINFKKSEDGAEAFTITKNSKQSGVQTFTDPENPDKTIDVKPLRVLKSADGSKIQLEATYTSGKKQGQKTLLDYDEVQDWLFTNFDIVNPQTMMDNPSGTTPKNKTNDLSKSTPTQTAALAAFEKQYKRKPTPTEVEKILKKYK